MPGKDVLFMRIWFMINPESAIKPVIFPDVSDAVQWNVVPGTFEESTIYVESVEQIDFCNGLVVSSGGGLKETWTVSLPVQPELLVT